MVVLGFGDVRLALVLGALLGWYGLEYVLYGALLGHVLASSSASACASASARLRLSFAFGPPLLDRHAGRRTAARLADGGTAERWALPLVVTSLASRCRIVPALAEGRESKAVRWPRSFGCIPPRSEEDSADEIDHRMTGADPATAHDAVRPLSGSGPSRHQHGARRRPRSPSGTVGLRDGGQLRADPELVE